MTSDIPAQPANAGAFRLLHTMIRVADLDKSIDFYRRHLGMSLLRRRDFPGGRFTLVAIATDDIYGLCRRLEQDGVPVPRPPGPMKHGSTVIAFVEDPDGYKIELIQP
ncbi:MAG: VOC family protein [Sphingomonadales bacterium]